MFVCRKARQLRGDWEFLCRVTKIFVCEDTFQALSSRHLISMGDIV